MSRSSPLIWKLFCVVCAPLTETFWELRPTAVTDDRSERTLLRTFGPVLPNGRPANSIDPIALALLNVRLEAGRFLIPTPQANGRFSGSAPSFFREDQFNTNVDYQLNEKNWLAVKIYIPL